MMVGRGLKLVAAAALVIVCGVAGGARATMQTLSGVLKIPSIPSYLGGNLSVGASVIDATDEKAAFVFRVAKTCTIDRVVFRTATVSGSQTLRVGLQTVSATDGNPTGAAYGGMTVGTQAAPASDTIYEVTLGTGATATLGDIAAVVIEFDAAIGNVQVSSYNLLNGQTWAGSPYTTDYVGVPAWAHVTARLPALAVRCSDGTYPNIGTVIGSSNVSASISSSTTPDEQGNRFTFAGPVRAAGVWGIVSPVENVDIVLYDADGTTALRTVTLDKDVRGQTSGLVIFQLPFAGLSLAKDTVYRLVYKPTTTTSVTLYESAVPTAAMFDSWPDGQVWHKTVRTDAGSWTDTATTKTIWLGLLIDQIDDGAGAGGGLMRQPNLTGGMQ